MSELLSKGIKRNIDVLMISERKIDDSFLVGNLLTLFRMESWQKSTPLFFPYNFYKLRNWPTKLSDF